MAGTKSTPAVTPASPLIITHSRPPSYSGCPISPPPSAHLLHHYFLSPFPDPIFLFHHRTPPSPHPSTPTHTHLTLTSHLLLLPHPPPCTFALHLPLVSSPENWKGGHLCHNAGSHLQSCSGVKDGWLVGFFPSSPLRGSAGQTRREAQPAVCFLPVVTLPHFQVPFNKVTC